MQDLSDDNKSITHAWAQDPERSDYVIASTGRAAETPFSFAGKMVRITVPVAAGGGVDLMSRTLAPLSLRAQLPGKS